jgi:hypothetical protein
MELSGFSEPLGTNGNDAGGGGEVIGGVVLRRRPVPSFVRPSLVQWLLFSLLRGVYYFLFLALLPLSPDLRS